MSEHPTNFQQEGYADAEPVSYEEDPGGTSADLNEEVRKAFAEAHTTGKLSES